MIPVLFKEDEQVFTHNGIGALYESLSCDVIEEENGAFTMELEYPVDGEWFSELKDFRIIQAKPNDIDEPHNFRIYEIEKSIDELTVFVRANTRTNDLGNNLITNYVGKNVTPQQAMNGIKNNLIEPTNFDLISDIQTTSSVEWTRINPLNAIVGVRGSLVDIWGGQLKRTNTAIHLYSRRGRDNVVTIRPGKNIEGLNMTVSTAGLVTKILPTFTYRPVDVPKYQMVTKSDGSKEKRRVPTSGGTTIRDDITVLGDVVSSQYVDNYPTNYWSSVDYGDDEELKDTVDNYIDTRLTAAEESTTILDMSRFETDLKNFVKTELDKRAKQYFTHRNPGVDKPTVRITVNMLQLSDSPDWEEFKDLERIGLTDTLDVWVEEYDIDVEVRVTSLTYASIAEQVMNFSAGSDRAPRQSAIEKKYDDLTKATNDYITSFKNGVQNILRNTADGLNRKFEGYTEPPAELSSEGDIWFKEIGEGKVEIWIHDGVYWQPLLSEDFANQIQAEVDDATEAANKAVDEINNAVEAAGFTSLEETVLDIKRISNNAQDNAGNALNNALEALNNAGTALDNSQTAISNSTDAIENASTALTNSQTALNRADSAMSSASDALTKADDAQDAATILSGQVSGFETTVAGFNQTVNNYEGQVSGFRNDILGLESTVASYESEVDEFGNTVSTYATEVSTMRNTVAGFESTVATYGQEVNSLTGEVSTYANQVSNFSNTVDGLNNTVASYEVELDEFGNTVSTYATEVSTMRNTVSGFESTVATYGTEVSNLAGEVVGYKNQVSTFNNTVNGFNSVVTQVQYDLDNLEIGGRNLLSYNYENYILSTYAYKELAPEETPFILKLYEKDNTVDMSGIYFGFTKNGVNDTGGTNWAYSNGVKRTILGDNLELTSDYRFFSFYPRTETVWNTILERYDLKLEKGSIATDWTPAPEDMATVSQVSTLSNTVDGLTSTVAEYETELIGYRGDVTQYKNQVSTMTNTVNGFNNTVAQYTTEVDEFGNEVNAYATQVSTLENTVDGFRSSVDKVEQDYQGISGTVATHTSSISNMNGQIALKANTTTVNALTGRVSTAETGITSNANAIKLKASQSSVDTLTGTVNNLGANIDVVAGQISSKVWNTDIETAIDGLAVEGQNLIRRVGEVVGHQTISGTLYHHEKLRLSVHLIDVEPNSDYAISNPSDPGEFWRLSWFDKDGQQIRYDEIDSRSPTFNPIIKSPDNASKLRVSYPNAQKVKLEKGNEVTDWTLAPEDVTEAINHVETEITQKYDSISSTVSSIDGRVTSQKQTLDSISSTVSGHDGRLSTVEQTASGLQTTVASKASQTQVTQLSNLVSTKVTASQVNESILADKRYKDTRNDNKPPSWYSSNYSRETVMEFKLLSTMGISGEGSYGILESLVPWDDLSGGGIRQTLRTDMGVWEREQNGPSAWKAWRKTADQTWVGAQISVLEDNINLRVVSKDGLLSQINIEAGRTLIESKKIVLNADTTIIRGTTWMDGAVIKDATIASAKITSLDVSKISGNTSTFVSTAWNSAAGGGVTITGGGIRSIASDNSEVYIQNGIVGARNPQGASLGHFGYNWTTDRAFLNLETSLGTNFSISARKGTSGNTTRYTMMDIFPGSSETYIRTDEFRHVGATDSTATPMARFSGEVRIDGDITANSSNMAIQQINWRYGSWIYDHPNNSDFMIVGGNKLRFFTRGAGSGGSLEAYRVDNTHIYMFRTLSMEGNNITNQSDARLKHDILTHEESSLDKINNLNFVDFKWNKDGREDFGLIAQQVQMIAPELVVDGGEGYLSLNNSLLNMMTSHAVQELASKYDSVIQTVDSHTDIIHKLQQELSKANRRIEELEGAM